MKFQRLLGILVGHIISVDGCPVILHGNRNPAVFLAKIVHLVSLLNVAVLTLGIVAAQHIRAALIRIVVDGEVRHRKVSGAVAEYQGGISAECMDGADDTGIPQPSFRNGIHIPWWSQSTAYHAQCGSPP